MKFSLLGDAEIDASVDTSIIYNLSIDKAIENISGSNERNEYFARVLCNIPKNEDCIIKRRELLEDFSQIDGLFSELKSLFRRYDRLKSDWVELKGSTDLTAENKGGEVALEYCWSSLKLTSTFPKTIYSFYCSLHEILASYPIKSRVLCEIDKYCTETIENKAFEKLCNIANEFSYNKVEDYDFSVLSELDFEASLFGCDITEISEKTEKKKNIFDKFKARKSEGDIIFSAEDEAARDAEFILCEALNRIDALLEQVTDKIYDVFYGISRELDFYESALEYSVFLNSNKIVHCEAQISDRLYFDNLYDLLLLSEKETEVIPNCFSLLGATGAIIRGKNNTGKTTFLRSVATAVLFASAGLPIAAEKAEIPLYSSVFSHFSSSEEEFISGDTSGRFESEVKAVCEIVNNLSENSLIILNETFQTTSYDEASAGILPILRVFVKEKCNFIFVTHLTDLFDISDDNIEKYESEEGKYKIIPIEERNQ